MSNMERIVPNVIRDTVLQFSTRDGRDISSLLEKRIREHAESLSQTYSVWSPEHSAAYESVLALIGEKP